MKKFKKIEQNIARKLRGQRQPFSGGLYWRKGDIKTEELLVDVKSTEGKSISVSIEMLEKISNESQLYGKEPALVLCFNNMKHLLDKEWIVLPLRLFEKD